MRKLRKFLRILLIILPFSIVGISYATEFEGNQVYDGAYIDTGDSHVQDGDEFLNSIDTTIKGIMDKLFFEGFSDIIDGFGQGVISGKKYSEIALQNYNEFIPFIEHYGTYGTINLIPGEEYTSDDWNIPHSVRFTKIDYAYSYRDYPEQGSFWSGYWSISELDVTDSYTYENIDPWGAKIIASWDNGKLSYNIDLSNLDPGVIYESGLGIRIETTFYSNQLGGIIRVVSPQAAGVFLNPIDNCTVTDGNTIHIDDNSGTFKFRQYLDDSQIGYIQYYWSDYVINEVPAYEPPVLQYPQRTYIDNSTGDTVTNNYYDEEVYYYNYMQSVINQIENAGSANDFSFDMDWGLLNLPIGIIATSLDALEYSPTLEFHTSAHEFTLVGGETFTFPKLDLSFDPNNYAWLTPFRYLISLFILVGLAKCLWKMIQNVVNGGGENNAN